MERALRLPNRFIHGSFSLCPRACYFHQVVPGVLSGDKEPLP